MFEFEANHELHLSTQAYLESICAVDPNDLRLEIYQHLKKAVSKIDPFLFVTITFASKLMDETTCEGICQRITTQIERMVVGRYASKLPSFVVLERRGSKSFHAHILLGRVQGKTRSLATMTLRSYLQKKPVSAIFKILNRLTYPAAKGKVGRIGLCDIRPVYSKEGAIDYTLKSLKRNRLFIAVLATNIDLSGSPSSMLPVRSIRPRGSKQRRKNAAWLASNPNFSGSSVSVRPLRPKRPNRKKRIT